MRSRCPSTDAGLPAAGRGVDRACARGVVLTALILVAAVANLNLAVANVALPDIGKAFDAGADGAQPRRRRLLARARGVGAVSRRARRPLRAQADAAARHGARRSRRRCVAAFAPSIEVLFAARLLGGLAAGMAYPDDARADHRAVVGTGAHEVDRAVVRPRRRDRRARAAAVRRAARPVRLGLGVPDHAAAGRRRAVPGAGASCPRTSTRRPIRSTTSAASSRCCSSRRSCSRSTSRRCPDEAHAGRSRSALIAVAAGARVRPAPAARAPTRSTTSRSRAAASSGSRRAPGSSCSAR